jgi:hypothetical protein
MSKQLAGTAQNRTAYINDNNSFEFGVELILLLVEKQYRYKNNEMRTDVVSETVRVLLSKSSATQLRDTLNEIIERLEKTEKIFAK